MAAPGAPADLPPGASASAVADPRAFAPDQVEAAAAPASSHVGGGPRYGSGIVAAAEGDAPGAVGAVAGDQVGAAAARDASGAAGGGAAGKLADGDVRGAAEDRAGVDPRLAGADSRDDVERVAVSDANQAARDKSGLAAAESRVEGERRHAESQVDVEGRVRSEVDGAESEAQGRAEDQVPGEARDAKYEAEHASGRAGAPPDAPADVRAAEFRAQAEAGRAERDARRPESEAGSAVATAESRTADARDPSGAASRHGSVQRAEHLGDSEADARRAEDAAKHPDSHVKDAVKKKLDDE